MGKSERLSRKARDYITERMRDSGEMTKEEIKDLIRPHFNFDYNLAKEQAIGRYANRLVSSLRDEQGIRTSFTLQSQDLVVNVERSKNLRHVRAVKKQLEKQLTGVYASFKKVKAKESELLGQTSLYDGETTREAFDFGAVASM